MGLLRTHTSAVESWNETTQTPVVTYTLGKFTHEIWFENPTSLALKVAWAKAQGVQGVGCWTANSINTANGSQVAEFWSAMAATVKTKTDDELLPLRPTAAAPTRASRSAQRSVHRSKQGHYTQFRIPALVVAQSRANLSWSCSALPPVLVKTDAASGPVTPTVRPTPTDEAIVGGRDLAVAEWLAHGVEPRVAVANARLTYVARGL